MLKKSIKAFCEMCLIKILKNILWNVLTGGRVCRAVDSLRSARCRPTKADKSKVDDPARLHTSYTVNRHSNSVPFSLSHFHLSIKAVNLNPWWWWLPAQFTTLFPLYLPLSQNLSTGFLSHRRLPLSLSIGGTEPPLGLILTKLSLSDPHHVPLWVSAKLELH